jgi:hypothetical protein
MNEILQAPAPSRLIREARGLIELPRLLLRFPGLARQPRGNREPVMILPGYGCGDGSTIILKIYLQLLGYRVRGWGLGRNVGVVADLLPRILKRLASLSRRSDHQTVTIIGWSLGGYLARELARERPDLVRQVITLGTPVIGGPKYTVVAESYLKRGIDIDAIAAEVEWRSNAALLETPVLAIYSRADGIVAWQACIDRQTPHVEHVEVKTTHLGFGFSPDVYKIIARALATTADKQPAIAEPKPKRRHEPRVHRRTGIKA